MMTIILSSSLFVVSCDDELNMNLVPEISKDLMAEVHVADPVDLGLSVQWASWNIGASAPEEYGGYYAWGENRMKDYNSIKTFNEKCDSLLRNDISIYYGINERFYDIAYIKWGKEWRTPTKIELEELVAECDWVWCVYKNVYGYEVIGPNGNSIFLPSAGCYTDNVNRAIHTHGIYRCGADETVMYFYSDMYGTYNSIYPYYGCSIRPVTSY